MEDQLSASGGDAELQTKFDELQTSFNTLKGEKEGLQSAVTQALELNSLTSDLQENATGVQGVELLGKNVKSMELPEIGIHSLIMMVLKMMIIRNLIHHKTTGIIKCLQIKVNIQL